MKSDDVEKMLGGADPPRPGKMAHQAELKIPLLSYRRSSKAGLVLLVIPAIVASTYVLKSDFAFSSGLIDSIGSIFAAVDGNPVLTYLIPLLFVGAPLAAMIVNFLAFSHFTFSREQKELLVTFKYRPVNFIIFLMSFAILVFFLLPDRLSF